MASLLAVARALFSTAHEKDVQDLPQQNKHILGVTSLWMIIPIILRWEYGDGQESASTATLAVLLAAVCAASTLFWSNPESNSATHKADKLLAWMYCLALIWCTVWPTGRRKIGFMAAVPLIASVLAFFILSDMYFRLNSPGLQLCSHLLFRYVFYWWSHLILVPTDTNFVDGFMLLSTGYVGHILFMYHAVDWKPNQPQRRRYWLSCMLSLCWILFCANMHTRLVSVRKAML